MRLWADVHDASGGRIGPGPVATLLSASVTRALDGAGTVQAEAPGTDERAISLLQNERRWRVWWKAEDDAPAREVGRGIIRGVAVKGSSSAWRLSLDGPDALDELRRVNTLLGRTYPAATIGALVANLAAMAGWTASVEAPIRDKVLSARFDGESVLKAIRTLCQQQGVHMRYGGGSLVEVGAFGQSSGVRLVQAEFAPPELYGRDELMLIESLTVDTDSESLCNWIVPVGGGEGESTLSLEYATRSTPYSVRVNYDNGKPAYYLADDASIARYGRIQKVMAFKSIAPISNSDADLLNAANQLHDAASAYLQRHSVPLSSYSVQAKKGRVTIKPGDKIRLVYKGLVYRDDGTPYTYLDIDQDVWIMRVSERVGDGSSVSLELATIDRYAESGVTIVANALESIQVRDLRVQPYPSLATYVYRREIAPGFNADVPIDITNGTLYLNQCRVRIKTRPFRATSKAESASETVTGAGGAVVTSTAAGGSSTQTSAGGGNHTHIMFRDLGTGTPNTSNRRYLTNVAGGGGASIFVGGLSLDTAGDLVTFSSSGDHSHEISIPDHTHAINLPAHTHTLPALLVNYGIVDDSQTPSGLRISINGVDVTAALGGPWAETGGEVETWVDITRYLTNASGGLRQQHRLTISCDGGRGEVEATIELRLTVQSIALGDVDTGGTLTPGGGGGGGIVDLVTGTTGTLPRGRMELMIGATALADGEQGAVPEPLAGQQGYFLRGDGTWQPVSGGGGLGGVQSVDVSAPSDLLQALDGPITGIGTIRLEKAAGTPANRVYASPDGVSGAAAFRALSGADLPTHTHGAADITSLPGHSHAADDITSGTIDAARLPTIGIIGGGTGATTASAARAALGLAIGTNVQAQSARLGEIAALVGLSKGDILAWSGTAWVRRSVGATGHVLTADTTESTGLKWAAAGGGERSVAILAREVSRGAAGQNVPPGVFTAVSINIKKFDPSNIVNLNNNLITPISGTYIFTAYVPCVAGGDVNFFTMLRNTITDAPIGDSLNARSTGNIPAVAYLTTQFTANGTDSYALQIYPIEGPLRVGATTFNNVTSAGERYLVIKLEKIG